VEKLVPVVEPSVEQDDHAGGPHQRLSFLEGLRRDPEHLKS
jgi:hypothetical protein